MAIKLNKPSPPAAAPKASGGRFKVFDSVPIPKKHVDYNFGDLEEGQMMFVPIEGDDMNDPAKVQSRVSAAASSFGKRNGGKKFVTQVISMEGELGVGVWRVA
jgi:hypothetical protein